MFGIKRKCALYTAGLLTGFILLAPARGWSQTPFTLQQVQQVAPASPDSALRMLDVMEEKGWEQPWFIEAQRAKVHFENEHYVLAVECAKKAFALDSLRKHPVPYIETVTCCIKAFHQLNEWDDCLQLLNHGIDYARRHGNKQVEEDLLFIMGKTYYHWGQRSESYRYLNDPLVRRLLVIGIGLLILLLCAALLHLYSLWQRNRSLAGQQVEVQQPVVETDEPEPDGSSDGGPSENPTPTVDDPDYRLYLKLEKLLREDRLFLRPDLSRQDLLDLLAIDKNRFAQVMHTYAKCTLPQYITELRIAYALQVFQEYPNFTVQAVSDASGFSNLRHFQRAFKQVTGITPSEYKSQFSPPPPLQMVDLEDFMVLFAF